MEEDRIFYNQGELRGKAFIYRQASPDGNRLCEVHLKNPDFSPPRILAEGSRDNPITKFEVTRDHIYFLREQIGVSVTLYQKEDSERLTKRELPYEAGYRDFFRDAGGCGDDRPGRVPWCERRPD
mgnify:CR=1 FL=1